MKQTFKIIMLAFSLFLITESAMAQVPQLFNYQGIARDAKGNPLSNQKMSLKLAVLPTADATVAEYEETQIVNTNEFGLYTLQIGNGTAVTGEMKNVRWETGNKYIKVAVDPTGGSNYADAGINQLLSVPYAIYADRAGVAANGGNDKTRSGAVSTSAAGTGTVNYITKFTAANTIANSLIYDNGSSVGIGTAAPSAGTKLHLLTTTGNVEHLRMQNTDSLGFGKFIMYNDVAANYGTFTKYGSAFPGGYAGIAAQYPYANMLAFGNNNGATLLANVGNVGIGIVSGGTTKLYFNAQHISGYLGIGGNALPAANVHFNNSTAGDTLRITNAITGHTNNDGLEIRTTGNGASIINKEASTLTFGTNDTAVITITSAGTTEFMGQINIAGGAPGAGKVLTSDANGLATWENATPSTHYIGELYGGGVVFHIYRDALGVEHGLIVAITDQSTSQIGSNVAAPVGTAGSTWDGLTNSNAMVTQPGHTTSAAQLCLNLVSGGQSDWYLPAVDELTLLAKNRFNVNQTLSTAVGGNEIEYDRYWSSTEFVGSTSSFTYDFYTSTTAYYGRTNNSYFVRAVRNF